MEGRGMQTAFSPRSLRDSAADGALESHRQLFLSSTFACFLSTSFSLVYVCFSHASVFFVYVCCPHYLRTWPFLFLCFVHVPLPHELLFSFFSLAGVFDSAVAYGPSGSQADAGGQVP